MRRDCAQVFAWEVGSKKALPVCDGGGIFGRSVAVDEKAEVEELGIGGWWPVRNAAGKLNKTASCWFAVRLTPQSAPWTFRADGQSLRLIATLEALGVLLACGVWPRSLDRSSKPLLQLPAFTDNRGNGFAKKQTCDDQVLALRQSDGAVSADGDLQGACWSPMDATRAQRGGRRLVQFQL